MGPGPTATCTFDERRLSALVQIPDSACGCRRSADEDPCVVLTVRGEGYGSPLSDRPTAGKQPKGCH